MDIDEFISAVLMRFLMAYGENGKGEPLSIDKAGQIVAGFLYL